MTKGVLLSETDNSPDENRLDCLEVVSTLTCSSVLAEKEMPDDARHNKNTLLAELAEVLGASGLLTGGGLKHPS